MTKLRHIIPLLAGLAFLTFAVTGNARGPRKDRQADALKAEYIFMEGVAAQNDSRYDDAMLLLDRAKRLAPQDADIAGAYGEMVILTSYGDSAAQAQAYADIRRRYLANPADLDNGLFLAAVAQRNYKYADERMAYRLLTAAHPDNSDLAMRRAASMSRALSNGDTAAADTALAIYARLEAGMGPDPTVINNRIAVLAKLRDTTAIMSELHKLYASAPTDPDICLMTGSTFYALSMPDSAILYIDRACELDSTRGDAFLTRAQYYLAEGDSARYDTEVFRALESEDLDFGPKMQLLNNYVRELYADTTRTESIARMFNVMLDIHPGEGELHNFYGIYLASQGQTARAAEQFGYATDLDPEEESNWRFYMQTAFAAGDTTATIEAGRRASRLFPENLYYPLTTSGFLSMAGRDREALEVLDSIDLSGVENPQALAAYHTQRGDVLYKMQQPDSAFAQYDQAIALDPSNALALNNAAYYMSVEGRELDRARRYAEAALHEEPLNGTYIDTYAWVLYKQGDYEGARRQIDAVLAMIYSDSTAVEDPSMTPDTVPLEGTDDNIEIITEEVEEVLSPLEPSADIYDHAGDIYYMTGERERALDFWRRALELDPGDAVIRKKIKTGSIVTQ